MKHNYPVRSIKALSLMAGFTLTANVALADLYTIAGFTFDDANSVTTAAVVEGNHNLKIHSASQFAGRSDISAFANKGTEASRIYFHRERTIGRLLGGANHRRSVRNESLVVSFPDKNAGPPFPNVDRCTIELTWNGHGLRNKLGPDFVVYENGASEGFSVSVKTAGADAFTPPRYQFASEFDMTHNVNSTPIDLSSFGLAEGEMITAIRIRNLFNSEASAGADKVDHPSGQGYVLYRGDAGYASGYRLTAKTVGSSLALHKTAGEGFGDHRKADEGGGREFSTDDLDADLVFVAGLHDIELPPETLKTVAGQ